MHEQINILIDHIKEKNPLVLNITNHVTMDLVANGLLSIGASPIMSNAEQEIDALLQHTHSVVINLGTLNDAFMKLCKKTCDIANQLNKPIIFDPVGAGASQYRTKHCMSLLNDYNIAIIRGNASEIMALCGALPDTKGVDSSEDSNQAIESAHALSKKHNAAIVISGKIDIIIDQNEMKQHERGSPIMPSITGTGCLLSAVIAACHAVEKNRFLAAEIGTVFYGICGEIAEQKANGPGSFRTHFLDALHARLTRHHYEKN